MKQIKFLLMFLLGIALTTTYSCTKDEDDDNEEGTPTTTCYIKKELADDGTYSVVEYNSNHKVVKLLDYDELDQLYGSTELTYNSEGKVDKVEIYESGLLVTKLEIVYNAQGKLSTADIYNDDGTGLAKIAVYEYTFTGDYLTKVSAMVEVFGLTIEGERTEYTYVNGNAVTESFYEFDQTALSLVLKSTAEYEYDTKRNPYRGLGADNIMPDPQFVSNSNITKVTYKDNSGTVMDSYSYNFTYEYNTSNYPTKRTETSFDNQDVAVYTMDYDCN